jgi:hypothetical protein
MKQMTVSVLLRILRAVPPRTLITAYGVISQKIRISGGLYLLKDDVIQVCLPTLPFYLFEVGDVFPCTIKHEGCLVDVYGRPAFAETLLQEMKERRMELPDNMGIRVLTTYNGIYDVFAVPAYLPEQKELRLNLNFR